MKRDGYTIVEVMIFLAISGLLLSMAMIGSGNLARQTRYSDSVNSFHSKLQLTYEEVANGVNVRTDTDEDCVVGGGQPKRPGTDDCILLGKVVSFSYYGGKVAYIRNVTDDPSLAYASTGTPEQQIFQSRPKVMSTNEETYELAWGASVQSASRETNRTDTTVHPVKPGTSRAMINNVAFLRSPSGSQIIPYYFYSAGTDAGSVQVGLRLAAGILTPGNSATGTRAYICITNREEWTTATAPVSAIVLGVGQGSVAIDTKFNPTRTALGECEP